MAFMGDSRLAAFIDHTLLRPGASAPQIETLCSEARAHGFCSVCVHPRWIAACAKWLEGSTVRVCTVIAFPHGETLSESKAAEARLAVRAGAQELDMVVSRSAVLAGDWAAVEADVRGVVEAGQGVTVKVILETAGLEDDAIVGAARASVAGGADFVKTSTGFGEGGATLGAVRLMRATVGPEVGVKASGGIRTAEQAQAMIDAGANRLGCSAGVAIVRGEVSASDY